MTHPQGPYRIPFSFPIPDFSFPIPHSPFRRYMPKADAASDQTAEQVVKEGIARGAQTTKRSQAISQRAPETKFKENSSYLMEGWATFLRTAISHDVFWTLSGTAHAVCYV